MAPDFFDTAFRFVWREEFPLLLAAFVLVTASLMRSQPASRGHLINTGVFFLAALVGIAASGALYATGLKEVAGIVNESCTILSGIALLRLLTLFVFRIFLPLIGGRPPRIMEDIVTVVGVFLWGMLRLRFAGLDMSGLVTTSAVVTGVMAFSMQDTLGNILGGVALQLDNSLEIGDWVKIDDISGRVSDIRWRSTSIETRNWETVVVPNSVMMKTKFTVLGRRSGQASMWRRTLVFYTDLAQLPSQVMQVVQADLRQAEIENMSQDPKPDCIFTDFGQGYAKFAVRYWLTNLAVDEPTDSAVRAHIYATLRRAGVRIAAPEQNVLLTKENEKHLEALHQKEQSQRVSALKKIDLFSGLTDGELNDLSARLKYAPFVAGDVITRQGSVAHWLYLLTHGDVEVWIDAPGEQRRRVNIIHAGEVFGEMGLMTGAARSATVIARTDVECYLLDKASFEHILHARPELAQQISQILANRRVELETLRQLDDAERAQRQKSSEILASIKRFFGLKETS